MHEEIGQQLQPEVLSRSLDLALIGFAGQTDPGLDVTVFVNKPIAAIIPEGHRLDRHSLQLSDLREEKVPCLPRGTGIREAYERSCAQADLVPQLDIDAGSPNTLLRLTTRGTGVAVLSPSSAADDGPRVVPVKDAATHACLGLAAHPGRHSPAVRLFRAKLRTALQGNR
ncbi:LysR family transcriptional regulator substrate-binding protein [Streptomyces sp. NPDC002540]